MFRTLLACGLFVTALPYAASQDKATAKDKAQDAAKKILGEWFYEVDGMHVAWMVVKNKDDTWLVRGQYMAPKSKKILGGFEGKDYKFENGKLQFTNVWVRKPKSTYQDGSTITVEPSDDNHVLMVINNGKQKIKRESARLKR